MNRISTAIVAGGAILILAAWGVWAQMPQGQAGSVLGSNINPEDLSYAQQYLNRILAHGAWPPPAAGVIPNAITAAMTAEPIIEAAFGREFALSELPLHAGRSGPNWIITGTGHKNVAGKVAILFMRASDGTVLYLAIQQ